MLTNESIQWYLNITVLVRLKCKSWKPFNSISSSNAIRVTSDINLCRPSLLSSKTVAIHYYTNFPFQIQYKGYMHKSPNFPFHVQSSWCAHHVKTDRPPLLLGCLLWNSGPVIYKIWFKRFENLYLVYKLCHTFYSYFFIFFISVQSLGWKTPAGGLFVGTVAFVISQEG